MCIVAGVLTGCQSAPGGGLGGPPTGATLSEPAQMTQASSPVAYVAGEAVRGSDLTAGLYEAAGGEVLGEVVLGRLIERALSDRQLKVTQADVEKERSAVANELSADANEAQRLLDALRQRRGLGETRFAALLQRNAGLRMLCNAVDGPISVPGPSVQKAYREQYGPTFRVRLITATTLADANDLRRRAQGGEAFGELAAKHSTDASADRGGLLSPINPEDATYPSALRTVLTRLRPGEVSDVLALGETYAVLKLEEALPASPIVFADVEASLQEQVRRRLERLRMEQQARALVDHAQVVVLDPTLKPLWEQSTRSNTR